MAPVGPTWRIEACSSDECRAPMIWARTSAGKSMPIDAAPTERGSWHLVPMEGQAQPRAVFVAALNRHAYAGQLHTSHFATCPAAEKHRRARRG